MHTPHEVLLVRHGESESNAGQVSEDAASAGLTPLGMRQAEAVAAAFDAAPARFVVSPYRRAQLTAAPAIARFPQVPLETWPVHEFTFLSPSGYQGTTVESRKPAVEAYWGAGDAHAVTGEGAESFAMLLARVHDARLRLEAFEAGPIAVFSHKKFLNALLWSWLAGVPAASSSRMRRFREFDHALPFPNGAIVTVRFDSKGPWVGPVHTLHLEGTEA